MAKSYLSKRADYPVSTGGRAFTFVPVQYFAPTSSWWGVLTTSDEEEIAALDAGVASGLLDELSAEDLAFYTVVPVEVPAEVVVGNE